MSEATAGVTAIILAGQRPGGDRLAEHFGATHKALIEIGGEPMVSRVARVLLDEPEIGRILILSQEHELLSAHPKLLWTSAESRIAFEASSVTIAETLSQILRSGLSGPLLITTADNPLLDSKILRAFVEASRGLDLAAALVERRTLLASYPGSKRTWLPFRGGAYSGANLFWLGGPQALPVIDIWRRIEQDRKHRWRVIGAFGPLLLAGVALRLLSLEQAVRRIGRRFRLTARPVVLPYAEACIDVDKPADYELVSAILRQQGR